MYELLNPEDWNKLEKNWETQATAVEGDIVLKLDDLYCLLMVRGGYNNLVVYSKEYSIQNVKNMLRFLLILFFDFAIFYVRVECSHGRYNFLLRGAIGTPVQEKDGRDIRYFKISDNIEWLKVAAK